tara:strand:+ start:282 stop:869 length:588 start_codon:yes stop_codon:yes gene_type:complete
MANVDAPFGFVPVKMQGGAPYSGGQTEYLIADGASGNIFSGDLVTLRDTGTVLVAAAGQLNILGVFNGCFYTDSNGKPQYAKYWPTGTSASDAVAFVIDDPNVIFEGQEDSSDLAIVDIGQNNDFIATAGSTTTGRSGHEIDSSETTDGTAGLRIVAKSTDPSNSDVSAANCNWYVKIFEHINSSSGGKTHHAVS